MKFSPEVVSPGNAPPKVCTQSSEMTLRPRPYKNINVGLPKYRSSRSRVHVEHLISNSEVESNCSPESLPKASFVRGSRDSLKAMGAPSVSVEGCVELHKSARCEKDFKPVRGAAASPSLYMPAVASIKLDKIQ